MNPNFNNNASMAFVDLDNYIELKNFHEQMISGKIEGVARITYGNSTKYIFYTKDELINKLTDDLKEISEHLRRTEERNDQMHSLTQKCKKMLSSVQKMSFREFRKWRKNFKFIDND